MCQAKSRGLTCTLVMEAINSERSWEEIKDTGNSEPEPDSEKP